MNCEAGVEVLVESRLTCAREPVLKSPGVVRVIVPVHHEIEATVSFCVSALQGSTMPRMEIVLADDSEHGAWKHFAHQVRVGWCRTRGCKQGSAAAARNAGARGFQGEILVFVDADVKVEPEAIQALVEPIRSGVAEATVGNYTERVRGMNFASMYKQLYVATVYGRRHGYLRDEFWTALGAVRRDVFEQLGGFAHFPGATGEDTEFGCRLTAAGFRVLTVNASLAAHLKQLSLAGLLLNDWRKGSTSAGLLLKRGVPLTHFRHSSPRDIAAVGLACLIAGLASMCVVANSWILHGVLAAAASYLALRRDLLRTFWRHARRVVLPAMVLMWILDLVRAASVLKTVSGLCRNRLCSVLATHNHGTTARHTNN